MMLHFTKAILALTLLYAPAQAGPGPGVDALPGGAVVLDMSGKVSAHRPDGSKLALTRNSALPSGSVIETGADAKILFRLEDGSEILLQPNSRVALTQEQAGTSKTLLELFLGKLRAVITKRFTGQPSFQLGTPSAIVAVRGTQFDVEVNAHKVTEVDVQQGEVQVMGRNAVDRAVLLEPGFSTRVGMDMVPEPAIRTSKIRADPREERETKAKKPKGAHGDRQQPAQSSPESGHGTEPAEPSEPAQPPQPADPH